MSTHTLDQFRWFFVFLGAAVIVIGAVDGVTWVEVGAWSLIFLAWGIWIGEYWRRHQVEEVCIDDGCRRPATHERLDRFTCDGTPVTELVCSRHGQIKRDLRPRT